MPFDIVDDMKMPPRERARRYNIDELKVDQALIIPAGEKHTASAIYAGARNLGIKVSIRKLANGDFGVWRTA
jgi:hypothetical protein